MRKKTAFGLLLLVMAFLALSACQGIEVSGAASNSKSGQAVSGKKIFIPRVSVGTPNPPTYSTSYYMLTVDSATLNDMGCKIGQVDRDRPGYRDSVAVLDFGSPRKIGSEYGTDLFWMGPITISQIKSAIQNFSQGYYVCVGSDRQSRIYVGVGTTNYHTSISNTTDFYNHGQAWARMVNDLNAWEKTQGYSSQVFVIGANDIELAWNTPTVTKSWAQGYDSVNQYDFYNYGSLDGCGTYSNPNSTICGNGWTREDAWYITYGTKPVWPLPLIYATNGVNAEQWHLLSLYSANTKGYPFIFMGAFTQRQACDQAPGQCPGLDNTPAQGWNQLYTKINGNPLTKSDVPWSTDIKWWDGKVTMTISQASGEYQPQTETAGWYENLAKKIEEMLPGAKDKAAAEVLQEKLNIVKRVVSDQKEGQNKPASKDLGQVKPAPKTTDPVFQTGIFDGAGGPLQAWEGEFFNHWQGNVAGEFIFVSAGNAAGDPAFGRVAIIRISADRLIVSKKFISAPAGSGTIAVEGGSWPNITFTTKSGGKLLLDGLKEQLVPGK